MNGVQELTNRKQELFCREYAKRRKNMELCDEDKLKIEVYREIYEPSESVADSQIRYRLSKFTFNEKVKSRISYLIECDGVEYTWDYDQALEELFKMFYATQSNAHKYQLWERLNSTFGIKIGSKTEQEKADDSFKKFLEQFNEAV